jgi:hypothetical protein
MNSYGELEYSFDIGSMEHYILDIKLSEDTI